MPPPHDSERRSPLRMALPACPRCHDTVTSVTLRMASAFYCRCQSCGEIWAEPRTKDEPQQKQSA